MLSPADKERLFEQAQKKHPCRKIKMLNYYENGIDAWGWYKVIHRNGEHEIKGVHIKKSVKSFNNEIYEEGRPSTRYNVQATSISSMRVAQ